MPTKSGRTGTPTRRHKEPETIGLVAIRGLDDGEMYVEQWRRGDEPVQHLVKHLLDPKSKKLNTLGHIMLGYLHGPTELPVGDIKNLDPKTAEWINRMEKLNRSICIIPPIEEQERIAKERGIKV